jgi:hypothetical protein
MERNPAIQELLAKKRENFSSFSASGVGIYKDLYFPGNSVKQQNLPLRQKWEIDSILLMIS